MPPSRRYSGQPGAGSAGPRAPCRARSARARPRRPCRGSRAASCRRGPRRRRRRRRPCRAPARASSCRAAGRSRPGAAVVGLAPADVAFVGLDADEHRVALDAAADAEAHRLVGGDGEGDRDGAEIGDAHGGTFSDALEDFGVDDVGRPLAAQQREHRLDRAAAHAFHAGRGDAGDVRRQQQARASNSGSSPAAAGGRGRRARRRRAGLRRSAASTAGVSMTGPRATLIRMAVGFIVAQVAADEAARLVVQRAAQHDDVGLRANSVFVGGRPMAAAAIRAAASGRRRACRGRAAAASACRPRRRRRCRSAAAELGPSVGERRAAAQPSRRRRASSRGEAAPQVQHRGDAVLDDRGGVGARQVGDRDAARGGRGDRDHVEADAVAHDGAQARRVVEEVVGRAGCARSGRRHRRPARQVAGGASGATTTSQCWASTGCQAGWIGLVSRTRGLSSIREGPAMNGLTGGRGLRARPSRWRRA